MVRETEMIVIGEKYIEVMTCMIEETLESMVKVCIRLLYLVIHYINSSNKI